MADTLGGFEQAVLLAIIHLRNDAYGRKIRHEIETRLARNVAAGAVYATLDRLEEKGFASSKLRAGDAIRGGRPCRYFAVTGAGIHALNDARTAIDAVWHGFASPLKVRG